jgi:hypothetical protein
LKFIWYIIALVISFGALIFSQTHKTHPSEKNTAISINQKHISNDEFNSRFASVKNSSQNSDRQDFINSLVIKELMIQDAQKEGIDKDEAFRRSIQDYYEQSLIKQVMDKKFKSIKVAVSDAEIDRFASFQSSTLTLTALSAVDESAARKGRYKSQDIRIVRVNDLSGELVDRLATMQIGEVTVPVCSESGCDVFRLDSVSSPSVGIMSAEQRTKMRSMLMENKKQRAVDSWIAELRAKSDIKILIK